MRIASQVAWARLAGPRLAWLAERPGSPDGGKGTPMKAGARQRDITQIQLRSGGPHADLSNVARFLSLKSNLSTATVLLTAL